MRGFLLHWLVLTAALGATAWIMPGVAVTSLPALLVAALVLGFLNAILKPLLVILTLPITVLTLGLFYFVLNAILLSLVAWLVPGFVVEGFGAAFVGALVLSLLSWLLGSLAREDRQGD